MIIISSLSKSKVFFYGCISFVLGIAVASFLPFAFFYHDVVWLVFLLVLLVVLKIVFKNAVLRNWVIFFIFFVVAVLRYSVGVVEVSDQQISFFNERRVEVIGVVQEEVVVGVRNQQVIIGAESVRFIDGEWEDVSGRILISVLKYPDYRYGDRLKVSCLLKAPEQFDGFDYIRYLAKIGVYSECSFPAIVLVDRGNGSFVYGSMLGVKGAVKEVVNWNLSEPAAGMARAMLLGDKKGIGGELRDSFSRSGISHIVAISGMHIGIIAAFLMMVLIYVGVRRQFAFWVASVFLLAYVVLVGAPPSAVRAFFMGFLMMFAMYVGRLNYVRNALALALVVLLLMNPKLLRDDVGFQLSFLSVLSILLYYSIFDGFFCGVVDKFVKSKRVNKIITSVSRVVSVTLAAQVLVLPLVVYYFGVISFVVLASNLLVLWLVPALMVFIILSILISFILPVIGKVLFLLVGFMLDYIILVSEKLVALPYAYMEIDDINIYWVCFCYFVIWFLGRKLI